jgi:predicted hydrolase (HD superfamily)
MIGFWNDPEKVTTGCLHDFSYYAKDGTEAHNICGFRIPIIHFLIPP